MKKRLLSTMLAVCMLFSMLPTTAFAEEDPDTNLCEHHTAHDTAVCGYVEGVAGVACSHTHDETACYTWQTACSHTHEAACYPTMDGKKQGGGWSLPPVPMCAA